MTLSKREYCPTCKHIIARDRVDLSSIECRRFIHSITNMDMLANAKDYFTRFIRSVYRVKEFADDFQDKLDMKITCEEDLDSIKLWILDFINNPRDLETLRERFSEIDLYNFLQDDHSEIDMPFRDFYDAYSSSYDKPMNKNRVSRALSAFGLKATLKKIMCDGKMKSTMMLCASEDQLSELYRKNGFTYQIKL